MISVLLPVHGSSPFLGKALESLKAGLDNEVELIIIMDRVSANTENLVNSWARTTPAIKVIDSQGIGIAAALNTGLSVSRGGLVARMDADDIMIRQRLSIQKNFLSKNPRFVAVGTQVVFIDADEQILSYSKLPVFSWQINCELQLWNPLAHPSMMYRKSALIQAGGYNEELPPIEDFELARRLTKFGRIGNLGTYGLMYRRHLGQITARSKEDRITKTTRLFAQDEVLGRSQNTAAKLATLTSNASDRWSLIRALVIFTCNKPISGFLIILSQLTTLAIVIPALALSRFRN